MTYCIIRDPVGTDHDWFSLHMLKSCFGNNLNESPFKSLLSDTSDWIPVISGVPQGSVLGPCLFVIYINDIDDAVSSKILKFADDTKITASIYSVEE